MTQIDGLNFTQLTNLNIEGELYEHGSPFGGATAPLILSTANNAAETPLILRGGATTGAQDYDPVNSGLTYNDGSDVEIWRLWGTRSSAASNAGNLFLGYNTGDALSLTNAGYNTGIGYRALEANITGDNNVALGGEALLSNTGGDDNVGIGLEALRNNLIGIENTAVGNGALEEVTGNSNVALGFEAGNAITTGIQNVAIGHAALIQEPSGNNNTAVGQVALFGSTAGSQNTAIGRAALEVLQTGNDNTALGAGAASNLSSGSGNIFIGQGVTAGSTTESNRLDIGGLIKGDLAAGEVFLNLPTSAGSTGSLWADSGTVKVA